MKKKKKKILSNSNKLSNLKTFINDRKEQPWDLYILISLTVVPFLLTISGITSKIFDIFESGFLYGIIGLYFGIAFIANLFICLIMVFIFLQGLFGPSKDTLFSSSADIYIPIIYFICFYFFFIFFMTAFN